MLNKYCQAHDVKNLFVADGGPFVSQADKNLHLDDPGARDAHVRVHRRQEAEEGETSDATTHAHRRNVLQGCSARRPLAAGIAWTEAEAAQAHEHAQQAAQAAAGAKRRRSSRSSSRRTSTRRSRVLVDLIIPKDERSGSATDAGVPEFMDFMMIDQPERQLRCAAGWRGSTASAAGATTSRS